MLPLTLRLHRHPKTQILLQIRPAPQQYIPVPTGPSSYKIGKLEGVLYPLLRPCKQGRPQLSNSPTGLSCNTIHRLRLRPSLLHLYNLSSASRSFQRSQTRPKRPRKRIQRIQIFMEANLSEGSDPCKHHGSRVPG